MLAQDRNLVLALDAGSPLVSVALGRAGEALAVRAVPQERSSTQLLTLVAEVLDELGAGPGDLGGVIALAGPGSFTGLRVALATALGLHQALAAGGLRAHALPTLEVMAAAALGAGNAAPGKRHLVIAAVDALRGEWSAQAFRTDRTDRTAPPDHRGSADLPPLSPMRLLAARDLLRAAEPPDAEHFDADAMRSDASDPQGEDSELTVVAFGIDALAAALPPEARGPWARVHFVAAPALAPAALRLAAALAPEAWSSATLGAPIYSRQPATTPPRRRPSPAATDTAGRA